MFWLKKEIIGKSPRTYPYVTVFGDLSCNSNQMIEPNNPYLFASIGRHGLREPTVLVFYFKFKFSPHRRLGRTLGISNCIVLCKFDEFYDAKRTLLLKFNFRRLLHRHDTEMIIETIWTQITANPDL